MKNTFLLGLGLLTLSFAQAQTYDFGGQTITLKGKKTATLKVEESRTECYVYSEGDTLYVYEAEFFDSGNELAFYVENALAFKDISKEDLKVTTSTEESEGATIYIVEVFITEFVDKIRSTAFYTDESDVIMLAYQPVYFTTEADAKAYMEELKKK